MYHLAEMETERESALARATYPRAWDWDLNPGACTCRPRCCGLYPVHLSVSLSSLRWLWSALSVLESPVRQWRC